MKIMYRGKNTNPYFKKERKFCFVHIHPIWPYSSCTSGYKQVACAYRCHKMWSDHTRLYLHVSVLLCLCVSWKCRLSSGLFHSDLRTKILYAFHVPSCPTQLMWAVLYFYWFPNQKHIKRYGTAVMLRNYIWELP